MEPILVPRRLHGRRRLVTDFDRITAENVKEALGKAMAVHMQNEPEIRYLIDYYRGLQPIQNRVKDVRPDITYNTVINHASEIVAFKVSYLLSDPVVYISRTRGDESTDNISDKVNRLNDFMLLAGKQACDKEIADDFTITGVGYRKVVANPEYDGEGYSPFLVSTLNPRTTGVVYQNTSDKHSEAVFAFTYVDRGTKLGRVTTVYTKDSIFTLNKGQVRQEINPLGMIPIIEYVNNEYRMGAFEPVIDMLNDANVLESNRIEATEQNVQSLMWFNDVDLDEDQVARLRDKPSAFVFTRTIKDSVAPNIKNIVVDLQQADQQVLANDLYKKMLTIVGMPSTGDGNTSDSSNNGSTIVRNGWQHAEARAKDTETLWQRSDRRFLEAVIKICDSLLADKKLEKLELRADEVVGKFTRRNYEDVMTKATVLTTLLGSPKVHPKIAYQVSGMVPDPEEAYQEGMKWYEEQLKQVAEMGQGLTDVSSPTYYRRRVARSGSGRDTVAGTSGNTVQGTVSSQYSRTEVRERQTNGPGQGSSDSD